MNRSLTGHSFRLLTDCFLKLEGVPFKMGRNVVLAAYIARSRGGNVISTLEVTDGGHFKDHSFLIVRPASGRIYPSLHV